MNRHINRRRFLNTLMRSAGATGIVASCPVPVWAEGFINDALARRDPLPDSKSLVCVFLFGGNDSMNMICPRSNAEYDVYAEARQNLAINRDALLQINPATQDGAQYGFHPQCGAFKDLFDSGNLAVIANVGNLIRPVTVQQYRDRSVTLPKELFSHNSQQAQIQALQPNARTKVGWAGRMSDILDGANTTQTVAMNLSLFGNNDLQVGRDTLPYSLTSNGAITHRVIGNSRRREAFEALLQQTHEHIFAEAYADKQQAALNTAAEVNAALALGPPINTQFPGSRLSGQLAMVAKMISIRESLGMARQIFFVGMGGYDTHDEQNQRQPELFGELSEGLGAFYQATEELGVADSVTTFTMTDFGRTLTSNGDGTDHAWGGHQIVIGGSVLGGDIYGEMPMLELDGPDDVGGGRIIPKLAIEQLGASCANWFADFTPGEMNAMFPNLGNFTEPDLGFLA